MTKCKYGKVSDHHGWWLTINGKSVSNFDNESDVDEIINIEAQLNVKIDATKEAYEYISNIPFHSDEPHVQHFIDMAKSWLEK